MTIVKWVGMILGELQVLATSTTLNAGKKIKLLFDLV